MSLQIVLTSSSVLPLAKPSVMAPKGIHERAPLVLVAMEHEWSARSLDSILAPNGYAVLQARSGRQALDLARSTRPDALIVDASIPDLNGIEVCRLLQKADGWSSTTPIVLTTAESISRYQRLEAYSCGAWLFCGQPLDGEALLLQLRTFIEAKRKIDRLRDESLLDDETGLYSMRGLARRGREIGAEAVRRETALACVVIAPAGGASTGDSNPSSRTVEYFGRILRKCSRVSDAIGRIAQTDFAVIAPSTDSHGAVRLVERVKLAVAGDKPLTREPPSALTVHAGYHAVPNFAESRVDALEMLLRATTALRHVRGQRDGVTVKDYDELASVVS